MSDNKIDYTVAPADSNLLKGIGHPEDFVTGCLLCLEEVDNQIHVVLPQTFRMDPKALSVMYAPAKSRGQCL